MFHGKLQTTGRLITEQEKGGVLQLEEYCTKVWEKVMDVLSYKHPDTRPLSTASLESYPGQPLELVPVNMTEDTVTEIKERLCAGAGNGGGGGGRLGEPTALAPPIRYDK